MKAVILHYLQIYGVPLFLLIISFFTIRGLKKDQSFWSWFFALIPVIFSVVLLKIIFDQPPLWTALEHYEAVQSLESSAIEKIEIKKYLGRTWSKRKNVIDDREKITAILSSIQKEKKPIPEDWGVENQYRLKMVTKQGDFYFKIVHTGDDDFDVIYILCKKNEDLFSIGRYANYHFRDLGLFNWG